MKILTVVGARPQFIKLAPVSRALVKAGIAEVVVHTGQHYDANMSEVFFEELQIARPKHFLNVGSDRHGAQTAKMMAGLEEIILDEQPDRVLIYGDTNSTLAGAVVAAKLQIDVAHVEAGLRSGNRRMPEEINRILADHASDILFAPTNVAVANLKREGFAEGSVHLVGDVMYDAAIHYSGKATSNDRLTSSLGLDRGDYVLLTIHRAENTDSREVLRRITDAVVGVSRELRVICPLHPRTRQKLLDLSLLSVWESHVELIAPVGYLDMLALEKHARLIVTDSGGVQKEAYFQGTPCVTLRGETEWSELVEAGWNRLVPPEHADAAAILAPFSSTLTKPEGLYGEGQASERIVRVLQELE